MNKELEQCLTQFVSKALDVANKGIDTASEQIPLVLQEIVYWEMTQGFLYFIFSCICILFFFPLLKIAFKYLKEENTVFILIGSIAAVPLIAFVISLFNSFVAFKAIVAPRLVIIEYLKGLL